jgi:hypothetical protein
MEGIFGVGLEVGADARRQARDEPINYRAAGALAQSGDCKKM